MRAILEEILKECPENLKEALEVQLIQRRNAMHDKGMRAYAIEMQNVEFALGAMFTYNSISEKLVDVVKPEGCFFSVRGVKYQVKEGHEGGIEVTKQGQEMNKEISILTRASNRLTIS